MDKTQRHIIDLVASGQYETILNILQEIRMKPSVYTQETDRDTVIQAAKLDAQTELIEGVKTLFQAYLPQ